MVTFNLWTDTRQISASPNSHQYLILLVPFWKMTSFATKWIVFFGENHAAFCLVCALQQKQRYADETLSLKVTAMRATQWSNIFITHH